MALYVVGLTGPTGAGKSTVAAVLAEAGLLLIDADRLCREAVELGTPCLASLAEAFGGGILLPDGSLTGGSWPGGPFPHRRIPEGSIPWCIPPVIAMTKERLRQGSGRGGGRR